MPLFLKFSFLPRHFRFKIPDVIERLRQDSEGRTRASNLVFTIWAVFGGFILHFLLSNYLTVLLKPSYGEPVETAADMIRKNITPFVTPGNAIFKQLFEASPQPDYQELARRLVVPKNWREHDDMMDKVISTGLFARIGTRPDPFTVPEEEYKNWYRSSETIPGFHSFDGHIMNKKWPLKKAC